MFIANKFKLSNSKELRITKAALTLQKEFETIKIKDALIEKANLLLAPLISLVLQGNIYELPREIPKKDTFFFCMYEHCLAGWHLIDAASLINAIGEFNDALNELSTS